MQWDGLICSSTITPRRTLHMSLALSDLSFLPRTPCISQVRDPIESGSLWWANATLKVAPFYAAADAYVMNAQVGTAVCACTHSAHSYLHVGMRGLHAMEARCE